MAKADVLSVLYSKNKTPLEFHFDSLIAPPLISFLTPQDVFELNKIATSVKYSGNVKKKYKDIDKIMYNRGFIRYHAGTNRLVFTHSECNTIVVKVALDKIGLGDNPAEFKNQQLLKPFVTKVFEVTPCGTVGLFERVDPITSREEFESVAGDVFDLITKCFIGKYILEDIGSQYFMNWGLRRGFGMVLLDFPYVFELDGNKIYCNRPIVEGTKFPVCDGEIDYDIGFNNLVCKRCGKHYLAKELKAKEDQKMIIIKGGKSTMKTRLIKVQGKGKNKRVLFEPQPMTDTIIKEKPKPKKKKNTKLVVTLTNTNVNTTIDTTTIRESETPKINVSIEKEFINGAMSEDDKIKFDKVAENAESKEVIDSVTLNLSDHTEIKDSTKIIVENPRFKDKDVVVKEEKDMGILHPTNNETIQAAEDVVNSVENDYDEEDFEDETEEYEQYLSNRQRRQFKQTSKRKVSTNVDGF